MFPHDRVIQRMVEEEFRTNQLFKYPQEYDLYDQQKEVNLKLSSIRQEKKVPNFEGEKTAIDNFKKNDTYFKREAERIQNEEAAK